MFTLRYRHEDFCRIAANVCAAQLEGNIEARQYWISGNMQGWQNSPVTPNDSLSRDISISHSDAHGLAALLDSLAGTPDTAYLGAFAIDLPNHVINQEGAL